MIFGKTPSTKYERVLQQENVHGTTSRGGPRLTIVLLVMLACTTVGWLATLGAIFRHSQHTHNEHIHQHATSDEAGAPVEFHCGSSVEEAKANGCRFEPMQYGWTPPQCFYEELSDMYDPMVDRPWYTYPDWNEQIPTEQLQEGKEAQIYTPDYHAEHCVYCWRKLAWAVEHKMQYIDSKSANLEHSTHCGKGLVKQLFHPLGSSYTTAKLRFLSCVPLN